MITIYLAMIVALATVPNADSLPTAKVASVQQNLEITPGAFEGDILFPKSNARGVAIRGSGARWTNGIVPYEISSGYAVEQQNIIINAMRTLESLTAINSARCIQFRPRVSSDVYYITIENGSGCSSYVGQNTGINMVRRVTLQHPGCIYIGTIMHEFLHTLGFYHEQSRPDRDSYITVNYANIIAGTESNFDKYTTAAVDTQNTPYDYQSVMHYPRTAFSSNGLPTIVPTQSSATIGQRDTLSAIDIREVRLYYNCTANGVTLPPVATTTTVPIVTTKYSGLWSASSPTFIRPPGTTGSYYYDAILVRVSTSGTYIFSSNSTIDTYGCFYNNTFIPSTPLVNLVAQNDDGAGGAQFRISFDLQSGRTYTLVATTYSAGAQGSFVILASGPALVGLTHANIPPLSTTTTTTTTISTTRAPNSIVFSRPFITGVAASSECTAWNTFRAQLASRNYTSLKINGTNDPSGITLTNPSYASSIASALRTNTTFGPVVSNGYSWMVGSCDACSNGVELTATGNICQCSSGYTVRPCIATSNWGGINGATCRAGSQTIAVTFQYI